MIKLQTGMAGRFKLEKYKAGRDGNPIAETKEVAADWFDNLILDQGLNRIGSNSIASAINSILVGSGSGTPDPADTSLDSLVAITSSNHGVDAGVEPSPPYNLYVRNKRRFSAGSAAGNLSEVGAGWGSGANSLFSRALIVDGAGNPTTITVLDDEILDVSYELQIFPDLSDATGTVDIGGDVYDYTARASRVNVYSGNNGWGTTVHSGNTAATASSCRAYDGTIRGVTSVPSGSNNSGASSSSSEPYSPDSLIGSATVTWGIGDANFGGIRSVSLGVGWTWWQIEFANQVGGGPIPKDNTQELTLTISHSWARRPD